MSQSLIQKYTPRRIDDFELDNATKHWIHNAIKHDDMNIMLITNPGCGKTSLINAIIREYFANTQNFRQNIMTISPIKEQGISYYRGDVKTFCQTLSTIPNKKRFVVLDDLDLINEQSQQVFRTCIDKYSKNVHFLASCTNPQKVIESIQSRLTGVRISPLDLTAMSNIFNNIAEKEHITLDEESKEFILHVSNTSARTLINYLEKIKLTGYNRTLDVEIAKQLCTDISQKDFLQYLEFCMKNQTIEAIRRLYSFYEQGFSVMDILDNFFSFLKHNQVVSQDVFYKIIPILCKYIIAFNEIHEDPIELAFFTKNLIKVLRFC